MATVRARLIYHSISRSKKLAALSCHGARLLYTWIIPHADNLGRLDGEPEAVRSIVVPLLRDSISVRDVERWLREMHEVGLIYWYTVDGLRYLEVVGHDQRQRIVGHMRRASDYPARPDVQTELLPRPDSVTPEGEGEGEGTNPAPLSPHVMRLNTGVSYAPTVAQVEKWTRVYPAVDVPRELDKMVAWFDANKTRRKTRRGIERAIVGWLGREQDRARRSFDTPPSGPQRPVPPVVTASPPPTPEEHRKNARRAKELIDNLNATRGRKA